NAPQPAHPGCDPPGRPKAFETEPRRSRRSRASPRGAHQGFEIPRTTGHGGLPCRGACRRGSEMLESFDRVAAIHPARPVTERGPYVDTWGRKARAGLAAGVPATAGGGVETDASEGHHD